MSKVHPNGCSNAHAADIPIVQTVAIVNELGGEVTFREDYPVPSAGNNEVLAKVLYTGVCQSGMFKAQRTSGTEHQYIDHSHQISIPKKAQPQALMASR